MLVGGIRDLTLSNIYIKIKRDIRKTKTKITFATIIENL